MRVFLMLLLDLLCFLSNCAFMHEDALTFPFHLPFLDGSLRSHAVWHVIERAMLSSFTNTVRSIVSSIHRADMTLALSSSDVGRGPPDAVLKQALHGSVHGCALLVSWRHVYV
jgi:hypothetical protein